MAKRNDTTEGLGAAELVVSQTQLMTADGRPVRAFSEYVTGSRTADGRRIQSFALGAAIKAEGGPVVAMSLFPAGTLMTPDGRPVEAVQFFNVSGVAEPSGGGVAPPAAPTNVSPPTISGTAQEGQTLTAAPGVWNGNPTSRAYQWTRDGAGIPGATSLTRVLAALDVGKQMAILETATNEGGFGTAASAPTAVVTAAPVQNPAPVTLGNLTLSASTVQENAAPGTVIGSVIGLSSGSDWSFNDDCGGRLVKNGNNVVQGLVPFDFETPAEDRIWGITETHPNATNNGRVSTGTITVTNDVADDPTPVGDASPSAFGFTAQNNALPGEMYTSNSVTPTGFDTPTSISVSAGAQYEINGDGVWLSDAGTFLPGNSVKVRDDASTSYSTLKNAAVTIGGVVGTFAITTVAEPVPTAPVTSDLPGYVSGTNPPTPALALSAMVGWVLHCERATNSGFTTGYATESITLTSDMLTGYDGSGDGSMAHFPFPTIYTGLAGGTTYYFRYWLVNVSGVAGPKSNIWDDTMAAAVAPLYSVVHANKVGVTNNYANPASLAGVAITTTKAIVIPFNTGGHNPTGVTLGGVAGTEQPASTDRLGIFTFEGLTPGTVNCAMQFSGGSERSNAVILSIRDDVDLTTAIATATKPQANGAPPHATTTSLPDAVLRIAAIYSVGDADAFTINAPGIIVGVSEVMSGDTYGVAVAVFEATGGAVTPTFDNSGYYNASTVHAAAFAAGV